MKSLSSLVKSHSLNLHQLGAEGAPGLVLLGTVKRSNGVPCCAALSNVSRMPAHANTMIMGISELLMCLGMP